jgi:hypothetical protein
MAYASLPLTIQLKLTPVGPAGLCRLKMNPVGLMLDIHHLTPGSDVGVATTDGVGMTTEKRTFCVLEPGRTLPLPLSKLPPRALSKFPR